jgi:glyoxylase I family protein
MGTDVSLFKGIEHVAIAARDPERLAAWYVEHLEFRNSLSVHNGAGKRRTYFIALNDNFIEVMPCQKESGERENSDRGLSHLAVLVSDFDAAVARLDKMGARKDGGEKAGPWDSRIQFYRDPEGNLFHLLWRPKALTATQEPTTDA